MSRRRSELITIDFNGCAEGNKNSRLHKWGMASFCGLWVWCRRSSRRPCCPSLSNPSTSPWTAWPDGSGRCDNRMAAQRLPWDLLRASNGQEQAHTIKKNVSLFSRADRMKNSSFIWDSWRKIARALLGYFYKLLCFSISLFLQKHRLNKAIWCQTSYIYLSCCYVNESLFRSFNHLLRTQFKAPVHFKRLICCARD